MFEIRMTLPALVHGPGLAKNIMDKFSKEAGALLVQAVQEVLGQPEIYKLSDNYAKKKPTLSKYEHVAGKPASQPLILTGEGIYNALDWRLEGNTVVVQVEDGKGLDARGDDYAEAWEETTEYLEKGLKIVEPLLPDMLIRIVLEEMRL